jgi:hypothetical protein
MKCHREIWEADRTMRLNKGSIQTKTSTEQEGIYRGKRSTLKGIHVEPTYTVGKALGMFLESVHFGFLGNLFRLLEHLVKT